MKGLLHFFFLKLVVITIFNWLPACVSGSNAWIPVATAGLCAGFQAAMQNYAGVAVCFIGPSVSLTSMMGGGSGGSNRFMFLKPNSCQDIDWEVHDYIEACTVNDQIISISTEIRFSVNGLYDYSTDEIYARDDKHKDPGFRLQGQCVKLERQEWFGGHLDGFTLCSQEAGETPDMGRTSDKLTLAGVYKFEDANSYILSVTSVMYYCRVDYEQYGGLGDAHTMGRLTEDCERALNNNEYKIDNKRSPAQIIFSHAYEYGCTIENEYKARSFELCTDYF